MNQLNALKEFFAGFLRARGLARHFRRLLTFESVAQAGVSREVPPGLSEALTAAAQA